MNNKKRISLVFALPGIVMLQLALLGVLVSIIGIVSLTRGMEEEVERGVTAACQSYALVLQYATTSDGTVDEFLEKDLNNETGYDYTYFQGDTRERSSIEGVVGTKASEAVIDAVLNKGENYSAKDVLINGEKYYVAYRPLRNSTGHINGMAFVGQKKADITHYINLRRLRTAGMSAFLVVVLTLAIIFYVIQVVRAIKENNEAVKHLATGDLNISLSQKILSRNDELGDMSNSLLETANKIKNVIGSARISSGNVDDSAEYLSNTVNTISKTADSVSTSVSHVSAGAMNQAEAL